MDSSLSSSSSECSAGSRDTTDPLALVEPVLEALDQAFKKYEVEARAPTALLTSISEILAERSVFLPDFTPAGVRSKIKSLFSQTSTDSASPEIASLGKALDEIMESLVRDEATRLLISPKNESNSTGKLVLGTKNRNEYLETLRVYMADETSKAFMVSIADTAFELLQRVIGKIHSFQKNLSSGYALWEVPFNGAGKQALISLDQCPVVLKRAWVRPTKIYFLTGDESAAKFNIPFQTQLPVPGSPSTGHLRRLNYTANSLSQTDSSGLSSSSDRVDKTANSNAPSTSSPVGSGKIAPTIKVFIEDGNYVSLTLGKSEKVESIQKRAVAKFGSMLDGHANYAVWMQMIRPAGISSSATDSTWGLGASSGSAFSSSSSDDSPPPQQGKTPIKSSPPPAKLRKKLSRTNDLFCAAGTEDVHTLLSKYAPVGYRFMLRPEMSSPKSRQAPIMRPKEERPITPEPIRSPPKTRAAFSPKKESIVEVGSPKKIRIEPGRRGSFSSQSQPRMASVTHETPDFVNFSGSSELTEPESTTPEPDNQHSVFSEARTFDLSMLSDKFINASPGTSKRYAALVLQNSAPSGDDSEASEEEAQRKAFELIQKGGHRSTLSLPGLGLTYLPSELRFLPKYPRYLDLSHNRLETLPIWFSISYKQIRGLNLSANLITSVDALDKLKKIRTLDLSGNKLKAVPNVIFDLLTLTRLYLNFNELEELPEDVGKLTGLKEFALAGNKLKSLPISMARLSSLELLDIGYNSITDASSLGGCKRLAELFATANEFENMKQFYKLRSLESLDLSCNPLTSVPVGIGSLSRLIDLDLSQTAVTTVKEAAIEELEMLPVFVTTRWPSELDHLSDRITVAQRARFRAAEKAEKAERDDDSVSVSSSTSRSSNLLTTTTVDSERSASPNAAPQKRRKSETPAVADRARQTPTGSVSAVKATRRNSGPKSRVATKIVARQLNRSDSFSSSSESDDERDRFGSVQSYSSESDSDSDRFPISPGRKRGMSTSHDAIPNVRRHVPVGKVSTNDAAWSSRRTSSPNGVGTGNFTVSSSAIVTPTGSSTSARRSSKDSSSSSKRHNYGQKRFSTTSEIKNGANGNETPQGLIDMKIISLEHSEGYNVEHHRGRLVMNEFSFSPANLRLLHGLDDYFTHFFELNHVNFLAIDKELGVLVISILMEPEMFKSEEMHRVLIKSQLGDKTIWIPAALMRTQGKKNSSPKSVELSRAMEFIVEHQAGVLQLASIKHLADPAISKEILDYESRMNYNAFKFGVLYAGMGANEEDYYSNDTPTPEYSDFLEFLGDTIRLQHWPHFSGGLDVQNNRTGRLSVYKRWASLEIMFHVSTLLPFAADDPQQIERKKHLGNDVVIIVFQDEDAPPFQPSVMKSFFNHVFIVVRPIRVKQTIRYTVAVASKVGVGDHSPYVPEPAFFDLNADFRRFLYTKLVNAERSSYEAPNFSKALTRTRLQLLQEFSSTHSNNTLNKKIRLKTKAK